MQIFSLSALIFVAIKATTTLACSTGQPPIKDANTVTLNLYGPSENLIQTTSLGVLGTCHNSNAAFSTFNMAVGQNMFGRNIHVFTYSGSGCGGTTGINQLTNNNLCWAIPFGTASSFKIAVA